MAKSTKKPKKIYMDYAASASPNPSSIHILGVEAKSKLENARKDVADVLGARKEEIIFTSSGTESNNLAIQGVSFAQIFSRVTLPRVRGGTLAVKKFEQTSPHIITTNIEHPSVLETCKLLQKRNLAEITIVPVEENGIVDSKKIIKAIKKNTVLISVMYANNEIGTIQPIKEIAKEIRHWKKQAEKGQDFFRSSVLRVPIPARPFKNLALFPLLHTDAVQAVNYLDLNVEKLGVDLLTLSGSKIEGAGRVGVLYKKKIVPLVAIFGGGDQEYSLRPGTENLPEIVKFSSALKLVQDTKEKENKRLEKLRDYFIVSLHQIFSRVTLPRVRGGTLADKKFNEALLVINGSLENRLPNNINVTFLKIPSDLLVIELSAKGIMASSKSACKSGESGGSYVIKAIRPEADSEIGGVRFSLGKDTTKKDIVYTIKSLSEILTKLKKWYN